MKSISLYKVVTVLLFCILIIVALYFGRVFFVPLAFAIFLSMLLVPVSNWLESKGVNRIVATLLCLLLLLFFLAGMSLIIALQAVNLSEDMPQIQVKLEQLLETVQQKIQNQFGVAPEQQIEFVKEQVSKFSQSANKTITAFVSGSFGIIASFVLVILYMFFLLWKREKYEQFLLQLCSPQNKPVAQSILYQIRKISFQYLVGRLISMSFLAIFYFIGLSIIGIKDALLISLVAVLPTLIPYVGAFVGGIFPLLMALVSGSASMMLPTLGVLVAAQVIDNNIIEPLVMGKKLNLSPIFTIIALVMGELLWGIAGMMLFEPIFAIIRIVCAHIPSLHPYSFLLEDEEEDPKWASKLKSLLGKKA